MLVKGQIHSGKLFVVFAVDESQKRCTRPPYHRRGSGEAVSNFEFRQGAVATGAGPAQHRQTNSSTAAAAAAAAAGGAEVAVAMAPPDELRHSSSARPGSITTIITTTEQPVFYELF